MLILNLAAGKFEPLEFNTKDYEMFNSKYVLNVDTSYFSHEDAGNIENDIRCWETDPDRCNVTKNLNMDVFKFMELTSIVFDRVVIYRFLEHVPFTQVEYFIYLVSTVLKQGGYVDVIVPNYKILANMLVNEHSFMKDPNFDFHAHNITLTTELLNEPSCPHASIWTKERMTMLWELEKRFKVGLQHSSFKFDGRELYLRSFIQRV